MNAVSLTGRFTKDPDIRYGGKDGKLEIARFSIAVQKNFRREGEPDVDYFNCSAFGATASFIEKYFKKGMKIEVNGEIHNDNYQGKDGKMVYGYNIIANHVGFAESKKAYQATGAAAGSTNAPAPAIPQGAAAQTAAAEAAYEPRPFDDDEFLNLPDDSDGFAHVDDDEVLPFN